MASGLAEIAAALQRQLETTSAKSEQLRKMMLKSAVEVAKKPPPSVVFKGLLGSYMAVIKKSDGLTSARPASLKAIQTAEKNPTEATIKAAAAEMRKHLAELEKSSKSEKTFPAFKKGLEDVIKKTEALI